MASELVPQTSEEWTAPTQSTKPLPSDPQLLCGRLSNGLQYMLRHNEYPHNRIVAYLEVNVGSLNEKSEGEPRDDGLDGELSGEQGLAHVLEHCVFVGTHAFPTSEDLRTELASLGMSWGGDSNAYTDYRSTVYTLEAPYFTSEEGEEGGGERGGQEDVVMSSSTAAAPSTTADAASTHFTRSNLPRLLTILHELAFNATFPLTAVEKEKIAVLSEAAMRNTTEYRVEVAMTTQTQGENNIPHRLPIGLTSVVRSLTVEELQRFYKRWYQPQFMTLYVVGPFAAEKTGNACTDPLYAEVVSAIEGLFGKENNTWLPTASTSTPVVPDATVIPVPPCTDFIGRLQPFPNPLPLIPHAFGQPSTAPVMIAQSPMLSRFALSLQVKRPQTGYTISNISEFTTVVADMLASAVFDNRMSTLRNSFGVPPFSSIEFDDAASAEQQCAFRGLHVSADLTAEDGASSAPMMESRWFEAVAIAFSEALRLYEYGVLPKELQLAAASLLKDCRDASQTEDSMPSDDILSELQQSLYTVSTFGTRTQEYQLLQQVLPHISREMVSARAKEVLQFVKDVSDAFAAAAPAVREGNMTVGDVLRSLPLNVSMFVCAPGPNDLLEGLLPPSVAAATAPSDTPAAISGIAARVAAEERELSPLGPPAIPMLERGDSTSSDGAPGLIDRLRKVSSQRAKIVRMLSADEDEDEEEEGEEEGEGGDESDVSDESMGAGKAEAHDGKHDILISEDIPESILLEAVVSGRNRVSPPQDIDLPEELLTAETIDARIVEAQRVHAAAGVPYGLQPMPGSSTEAREYHAGADATIIRCSNGLTVIYKKTAFEPNLVGVSLVARGGKDVEGKDGYHGGLLPSPLLSSPLLSTSLCPNYTYGKYAAEIDPLPCGSTDLGLRTMFNSGCGAHSADSLERYAGMWGLGFSSAVSQEALQVSLSANCAAMPDGVTRAHLSPLARVFELIHLFLVDCRWEADAFQRARHEIISDLHGIPRSLERATNAALMHDSFGGDARYDLPSARGVKEMAVEIARRSIVEQLVPPNMQVTVVGDFDPSEVEALVMRYLAPLPVPADLPLLSSPPLSSPPLSHPLNDLPLISTPRPGVRWYHVHPNVTITGMLVHVPEAQERCHLVVSLPLLPKYPPNFVCTDVEEPVLRPDGTLNPLHKLYSYRCANVWLEVLNNRHYRKLRDASGACYAVSFAGSSSEFTAGGFGSLVATPIPSMTTNVLLEGIRVVLALFSGHEPLSNSELEEAQKPLIATVRTSIRTNSYWHSLLTYMKTHRSLKSWASVDDIGAFYQNVTLSDVQSALATLWASFPMPLPVHVACGYTGSATPIVGPKGAGIGKAAPADLFKVWMEQCKRQAKSA